MTSEMELIKKYFIPLSKNKESLELKNDGAWILNKKYSFVISTDMMIEDTHFKKKDCPKMLAKKILRVNLSDIAAMGAKQYGYVLNLALPKSKTKGWLKDFCDGLKEDQSFFKLKLFGGDLSISDKIFLSITILGKVDNKKIHSLNTAKKNSDIYVSGKIGDSIMGYLLKSNKKFSFLKKILDQSQTDYLHESHQLPNPELDLGSSLLNFADSCTDISDGLLMELDKISKFSGIKANIFLEKIPLSDTLKKIFKVSSINKNKVWNEILAGGEDYKLVFSVNRKLNNSKSFIKLSKKFKFTKIGFFSKGEGVDVLNKKGLKVNFKKIGFSHF